MIGMIRAGAPRVGGALFLLGVAFVIVSFGWGTVEPLFQLVGGWGIFWILVVVLAAWLGRNALYPKGGAK